MSRTIIVLGMHRSGTSVLTQTLMEAGAWFGEPGIAINANEENPRGFFERTDMRKLTDLALADLDCNWHDLHRLQGHRDSKISGHIVKEFTRTVAADLNRHPLSVLKDPRLCILFPHFKPALPNPAAVFIVREPAEVAMSLHERNGLPHTLGTALWEVYNRHAVAALNDMPWAAVRYEELVQEPEKTTRAMIAALRAAGVEGLDPDKALEAGAVARELHRQHAKTSDTRRLLTGEQFQLWKSLSEATLDPKPFATIRLSQAARETLAWHHAVCASASTLPYLRGLHSIPTAARSGARAAASAQARSKPKESQNREP